MSVLMGKARIKTSKTVKKVKPGDKRVHNQFWKARSTHGRAPIFANSDQLWDACVQYFEWVDKHPLQAAELVKFQGNAKIKYVPKMRAMTIAGLCVFLDISYQSWLNYRDRNDFFEVTNRVETIVTISKFEGAAAELLNPSIIARDLGLTEKAQIARTAGDEDQAQCFYELTDEQLLAIVLEGGKRAALPKQNKK